MKTNGPKSKLENDFAKNLERFRIPHLRQVKGLVPKRKFIADFVLTKRGKPVLVIEVQGMTFAFGRHNRGPGYENDARKMLLTRQHSGLATLYFTSRMVSDDECLKALKEVWKGF